MTIESLSHLVELLTADATTANQKVCIIYDWITSRIRYDVECYRSKSILGGGGDESMLALQTRQATCTGYTDLFQKMCRLAGNPTVKIIGYAKGAGYMPGDRFNNRLPNHVWNAVLLDGSWKLVDCCWGAGYINEHNTFSRWRYKDYFLFTPARDFIRDHFPLDSRWQLLDKTISLEDFEQQPHYRPGYYLHNVSESNQSQGFRLVEKDIELRYSLCHPLIFTYKLRKVDCNSSLPSFVSYSVTKRSVVFKIKLPIAGKYYFTIYGKTPVGMDEPIALASYCFVSIQSVKWSPDPSLASILWGPNKAFSDFGLTYKDYFSTVYTAKEGLCLIQLGCNARAPSQFWAQLRIMSCSLSSLNNDTRVSCSIVKDTLSINCRIKKKGLYRLFLFGRKRRSSTFRCLCNFLILCRTAYKERRVTSV